MPHRVVIAIFPRFQLLDAAGPIAAFEIASRFVPHAYTLQIVGATRRVVSSSGAAMHADPFPPRPRIHTLLVAGGDGTRDPTSPGLARFVAAAARNASRVASVCSGAFILAHLGLLDGKRATTHWQRAADLARKFPRVTVEPDRIFVRDGTTWTSAGITAGVDLALAMIADDLGEPVARQTAQHLVVYYRRPGGQSQFSTLLELDRGDFGALLGWMREHLAADLSVERLAARAAMSPRTFARRFAQHTGLTPARAVERLRVEAARVRVELTHAALEDVAAQVGLDPERMRRAFVRTYGQPPQALRRAARAQLT
jgi:transcriptional regulator GlxA family with amidase domain